MKTFYVVNRRSIHVPPLKYENMFLLRVAHYLNIGEVSPHRPLISVLWELNLHA